MPALPASNRNAVPFFLANAPYSYDPARETPLAGRRRCAKQLATAELWAIEQHYTFSWGHDPDIDSQEFSDEVPYYPTWQCVMRDTRGHGVQSLHGIDFGRDAEPWTSPYRRVVEAELALEQRSTQR